MFFLYNTKNTHTHIHTERSLKVVDATQHLVRWRAATAAALVTPFDDVLVVVVFYSKIFLLLFLFVGFVSNKLLLKVIIFFTFLYVNDMPT